MHGEEPDGDALYGGLCGWWNEDRYVGGGRCEPPRIPPMIVLRGSVSNSFLEKEMSRFNLSSVNYINTQRDREGLMRRMFEQDFFLIHKSKDNNKTILLLMRLGREWLCMFLEKMIVLQPPHLGSEIRPFRQK